MPCNVDGWYFVLSRPIPFMVNVARYLTSSSWGTASIFLVSLNRSNKNGYILPYVKLVFFSFHNVYINILELIRKHNKELTINH